MNSEETINRVTSSMIGQISRLRDVKTLLNVLKYHNKNILTDTVTDKIVSILEGIDKDIKENMNAITSYHYIDNLSEKLIKSSEMAKEAMENTEEYTLQSVPEDFDAENYDDSTGKYTE